MGCFIGCFGTERDLKRRKHKINHQSQRNKVEILENVNRESSIATGEYGKKPSDLVSELGNKSERNGEVIPSPRLSPRLSPSLSPRKRVTFDTNVTTYEHVLVNESVGSLPEHNTNFENECQEDDDDDDSVITTVGLYPPNHRYHNARDSDDDEYDSYSESDIDELDDEDEEELNEKDDEAYGLGTKLVLNPVENIIQWKAAKLKGTTVIPLKAQKENQEITAIDASLSNWLVSPEVTKYEKKNTTCIEDRTILGALTVEELRHNSVYSSPTRSPDEKPYWSNVDSAKRYNTAPSFI